jgi:hypothetical protein
MVQGIHGGLRISWVNYPRWPGNGKRKIELERMGKQPRAASLDSARQRRYRARFGAGPLGWQTDCSMVRTLRDGCCWAAAALFCAAGLPACRHAGGESTLTTRLDPPPTEATGTGVTQSQTDSPGPATAWDNRAGSPYLHPIDPPALPAGTKADIQVQRAVYPSDNALAESRPPAKTAQVVSAAAEDHAGPQIIHFPETPKRAAEPPLVAALRCFMENQPAQALALLKNYDKPNQEMLLGLLTLTVAVSRASLDHANPQEVNTYVAQLQSLLKPLLPRTQLCIDKMVFCEFIKGFGQYEPLRDGHKFRRQLGGQPGELVFLYVELLNLASVSCGDVCESRLSSVMTIRPPGGGQPIWHHKEPDRVFHSRTIRRDVFDNYMFYVPAIPQGRYEMWIEITDLHTGRRAARCLPFRVGLPGPATG